jgi:ferrous iron transport protein A
MPTVPLREMRKNQSGTITAVKVGGELGRRIRDMGIVPGTRIIIMGRAPLYDPVAIRIMVSDHRARHLLCYRPVRIPYV